MDLHSLSVDDLYGYLGVPVRLKVQKQETWIAGNVYTIDPVTRSVILAQYASDEKQRPQKIVWLPGQSIELLEELGDEEVSQFTDVESF